jgi:16S rRNA (guanine1207-N2)-methyltransferase
MMSHYFQNDPNLRDIEKEIKYNYKDVTLVLKTNTGVFSKNNIDFGTRVMLETLDCDFKNKKVLDLGCGYGIIGLAIAKANPSSSVDMVDVNPRAVELANNNKLINKISNASVYESNLYEKINLEYDYIISNPPIRAGKKTVFGVVEEAYNHLVSGGSIFVVIQKKQGALSLMKRMEEVFSNATILDKEKGYFIIESKKR